MDDNSDSKSTGVACSFCGGAGWISIDEIGKQILSERKRIGISQRALAEECGLSAASISNIEMGKANPRKPTITVIKMALDKFGAPKEAEEAEEAGTDSWNAGKAIDSWNAEKSQEAAREAEVDLWEDV